MPEQNPEHEVSSDFIDPVDPLEFKFCFVLLNTPPKEKVPSWTPSPPKEKLPSWVPSPDVVLRDGDDIVKLRLRRIPLNNGLIAVHKHYRQTRSDWSTGHHELRAMTMRLIEFLKVVKECLREGDVRVAKYVRIEHSGVTTIEPALAEAAATVDLGPNGFNISAMFAVAEALSSQETPIYIATERKPKRNPNGGRPPSGASSEQLAEWQKDMRRRGYVRKGAELPPELRRVTRG